MIPGEYPLKVKTKYVYLMTSVMLHAMSMLEYPALFATKGNWSTMPQTRRIRLATCMTVVLIGARTRPMFQKY